MLTSEFLPEMGALIRRLEGRVIRDPALQQNGPQDFLAIVEDAIVTLCATYLRLEEAARRDG